MNKLDFSIQINAPKEKVWDKLWSDAGYRKWTSVFMQGSYAESSWEEGSKIKFLAPDGGGMYGIIQKKIPLEAMVFEHKGEIKNGIEESKDWAGATEGYFLSEKNGGTELKVVLDANDEFKDYFSQTFPKALALVKQISEE